MTDIPNWAWAVPFAVLFMLRPRVLWAIIRLVATLVSAVVLAIFGFACL